MPTPNLFFCLVLPILLIVAGGAVGIWMELRRPTRPRTAEHPANPGGGKPWSR